MPLQNDNAFSLIMYDEDKHVLHAAIADFGIGIVQSVRNYIPSISCDKEALLKAAENNFTVKSTDRNKGKGLDNISRVQILEGYVVEKLC